MCARWHRGYAYDFSDRSVIGRHPPTPPNTPVYLYHSTSYSDKHSKK